jgi:hypothetical protein
MAGRFFFSPLRFVESCGMLVVDITVRSAVKEEGSRPALTPAKAVGCLLRTARERDCPRLKK